MYANTVSTAVVYLIWFSNNFYQHTYPGNEIVVVGAADNMNIWYYIYKKLKDLKENLFSKA